MCQIQKTSLDQDPDSFGPDLDPGLTEDVWHQKYENKKEGLQNYLENSFKSILNIFYRSGYRALDPKFGQNRIRNTVINKCHPPLRSFIRGEILKRLIQLTWKQCILNIVIIVYSKMICMERSLLRISFIRIRSPVAVNLIISDQTHGINKLTVRFTFHRIINIQWCKFCQSTCIRSKKCENRR